MNDIGTGRQELTEQARAWLDPALDFVFETGLSHVTLRPLAAHLGTSDRMLIYHFGTKEALIGAVLVHASERLTESIVRTLAPPPKRPIDALLKLWSILTAEDTAPYMRLYLELVIAAMRDDAAYGRAVRAITSQWLALTEGLLASTGATLPRAAAADALAMLDGMVLVQSATGVPVDARGSLRRLANSWEAR